MTEQKTVQVYTCFKSTSTKQETMAGRKKLKRIG